MTRSWSFAARIATVSLLCALAWPAIASAQDDAFRRGLEARGDKKWKDAAAQMRTAIERDPKESTRKIRTGLLGMGGGTEYLPYFFLGEALFNDQDCVGAVTAWSTSEQQDVVRARKEFVAVIANGYKACAARGVLPPGEFNPQYAAATQVVTEATALAQRVVTRGGANQGAWTTEMQEQYARLSGELNAAQTRLAAGTRARSAAEFAEARAIAGRVSAGLHTLDDAVTASIENLTAVRRQTREVDQVIAAAEITDRDIDGTKAELATALASSRQSGRDLLARARDRARAGEKAQSLAIVNDALRSAQDAASALARVLDEIRKIARGKLQQDLDDAVRAAFDAVSLLDTSFATLDRRAAEKPSVFAPEMVTRRDGLKNQTASIRRRLETAQKTENVNGLKDIARVAVDARTVLDEMISSFGPMTLRERGVHAALEDGARLFFAGEYQQVLSTLDSTALNDAPLQLHVHLFRAAALFHLFVRSGEKDVALRDRALREVEACKRLNPAFVPDARAFAPRFLLVFQQTPAAAAP